MSVNPIFIPFLDRLHVLAQSQSVPAWQGVMWLLRTILQRVWCQETCRGDLRGKWKHTDLSYGQDDVTALFLADQVFHAQIGMIRFNGCPNARFLVYQQVQGMTLVLDPCREWTASYIDLVNRWTPEHFREQYPHCFREINFCPPLQIDLNYQEDLRAREALFAERFERALVDLEYPVS